MINSNCGTEVRCKSELEPAADMNNSAILGGLNDSDWSYQNYGFRSLPTRGYKKNRRPGIKFVINSETVSQTKTIIYKDHQKSQDISLPKTVANDSANISKSSSSTSLNSNDNPEIVAALDQIASEMGLIEHPVTKQSNDPVTYLLATRSFSERFSANKLTPINKFDKPRPNSYICHSYSKSEIIDSTKIAKDDISIANSSPVQTKKKKGTISKIIEKLSPKSIRRSRSIPTSIHTPLPSPKISKLENNNIHKKTNIPVEKHIIPMKRESSQNQPEPTNSDNLTKKDPQYVNDNSKRLLNSLKVDRIEQPLDKFRMISRRRAECNMNQVPGEICKMDIPSPSLKIVDSSKFLAAETPNIDSVCEQPRPPSANSRYVNVSLCAFGYGPHQCTYKSPINRMSMNFCNDDDQNSHLISNESKDHFTSKKTRKKSITTDL